MTSIAHGGARAAIIDLMNLYCYAIDRGDLKTFGRLFKGAQWIAEGQVPGPEAANNLIIYADGTPRTKHTLSNIQVDVHEQAGTAKARSYVTVFQQTDDFPLQVIFAGDYFDDFVCIDGAWQFLRREIKFSLIGDMSAHLRVPGLTIPGA